MLKNAKLGVVVIFAAISLSSCYSYTSVVGKGPQKNQSVTKWNHYVIAGLAPVGVSDSKQMAAGAADYSVTTKQTFVNGLISALTFGIYTPTTTTVEK
ncbi:Bor family protein [Pedobacter sp. ASV1-7]|uniref:Bor family protein n=1 Tax=Pedobacter sp. ASV1-7 TaxID=3145237 RepID=UPI0032E8DEC9